MAEVWLVMSSWGEWSDYSNQVESVWDSEAGAVSHIVDDVGATLDQHPLAGISWVVDDEDDVYPTYYSVERRRVRHGG